MNEQALRISGSDSTTLGQGQPEYRSGVHAKGRRDTSLGWGLVLIGVGETPRSIALSDGAVIGSSSRDAAIEGEGVAPEHARVSVRSDGCYVEDLGSPEGTFVGGVRARRIGVMHGDVVRLGKRLAIFAERDLAGYTGAVTRMGGLVFGPKQRKDWVDPILELAKAGSSVCIEGPPGTGKRTLARLAGQLRESAGEVIVIDAAEGKPFAEGLGKSAGKPMPATWVVLNAERLPRPQQLEIAHAIQRTSGSSLIATTNQPLDRAAGDGLVAPWFVQLFGGKRVSVPSLEARREDIPLIVGDIAERRQIPQSRITPEFLEALVRAGWPGGVPQLESVVVAASQAADGPLQIASVAESLSRPSRAKPSLPPSTDPSLARARLEDALARANGSVASAARTLGMSRQAIYREADRLGLDIPRRKVRS